MSDHATQRDDDVTFQLAYGGPGAAGSMSVTELAPALLAFNEFIERSNEVLNGEKSVLELRVLANFESGSFDVNFRLHQTLLDSAAAMLPALATLTPSQILDVAVGTYERTKEVISGAAKIYKALRGEKPKEIKSGEQNDTRIIVIGNNNTIVTDVNSAKLYNDDRARNALTRAAEPLTRAGFDTFSIKRNDELVERLEPPDVSSIYFSDVQGDYIPENPDGQTRNVWVRVVKPNFDGGRWSFHDGSAKFGAELEDKDFQAKVNNREQGFFKGDTFLIRLRSFQHHDKNGNLTTRNVVEKILDQREGPRQKKLLN